MTAKVITITNQKGGVGKSVLALHIAWYARDKGLRVAFIDVDSQENSTTTLKAHTLEGVLASDFYSKKIEVQGNQPFALIPADPKLDDLDSKGVDIVRGFVDNMIIFKEDYDLIVIDTPPSPSLRMTAALIASDFAVAPVEMESYSIAGVTKLLKMVFGVQQRHNKKLKFLGMIPNRLNSNSVEQKNAMHSLFKAHGHLMIRKKIGIRVAIPKAISQKIPVWELKTTSGREAAKEVVAVLDEIFEKMELSA